MNYRLKYPQVLIKAEKEFKDLPTSTQNLIEKLERAFNNLLKADEADQQRLLPLIVQSDAIVAADIVKTTNQPQEKKIDKLKLLELEARARQLRRKTKTETN